MKVPVRWAVLDTDPDGTQQALVSAAVNITTPRAFTKHFPISCARHHLLSCSAPSRDAVPAVTEVPKSRDLPKGTQHTVAEPGFKSRFLTFQGPFSLPPNWQLAGTPQFPTGWSFRVRQQGRDGVQSLLTGVSDVHAGLTMESASLCSNPGRWQPQAPHSHPHCAPRAC